MSVAYAHAGEVHDPQVAENLWLHIAFDPVFLIPLVIALFYARGWWRHHRAGSRLFPPWRALAFMTGLLVVAISLLSGIDVLADRSFAFHMVQHELLTLVAVPLLLLGAPFVLTVRGIPRPLREWIFIPLAKNFLVRRAVRFLLSPLPAFILFELNLLVWHFPAFYDLAIADPFWHYMEHFCFMAGAALFWWNIITPHPFPPRLNLLVRALMVFAVSVPGVLLSAIFSFAQTVLYDSYANLDGFMGLTMLQDQRLGGVLMWTAGTVIRLPVIIGLLIMYARQEEAKEPYRMSGQSGGKTKPKRGSALLPTS